MLCDDYKIEKRFSYEIPLAFFEELFSILNNDILTLTDGEYCIMNFLLYDKSFKCENCIENFNASCNTSAFYDFLQSPAGREFMTKLSKGIERRLNNGK